MSKRGTCLLKETPSSVHLLHSWRAAMSGNISMADEGLWQRDSDVVVEEDESMEMDEPADSGSPAVLLEKAFPEGPEAEADEDQHSHTTEESMDQNPPHDLDLDEDKLLGPLADVSVPGGHSDDSVALIVSPGDDDL